jgi:sugar transferase (PEP-CTERM system associated)
MNPADLRAASATDVPLARHDHPRFLESSMVRYLREQGARWLVLLAICEGLLLVAAMVAAMHVRYWGQPDELLLHSTHLYPRALLFGVVLVGALSALGLYQPRLRESWFGLFARHAIGFALGGIAVALLYYIIPQAYVGRGVLGLALLIGFPVVLAFRATFMRLIDVEALKRRVLVLGSGRRAAMVNERMRRRVDRRGFNVIGFVAMPNETASVPADQLVAQGEVLYDYVRRMQINEIVVGPDDRRGMLPMDQLLECKQQGIAVTDLITFFERELGKVKLGLIDPSWLVFSDGFDASPMRRLSKRVFDIVAASAVLLLTWPLMLGATLAIRIESGRGAPILYRQERVGERGKGFPLIKFRSMRTDAEKDGVARWASQHDDRVTRVGRFIRKVRIDELPQLWNVLRGDMSLIGPRPERPTFVADLATKIKYYELRHCVKPGLAGWAQLNYPYGATEEDAAEKLKYDLFYVKNHNLMLDLMILIQTLEVVLFRRGAR